mgnify:CR=1 FL=1
MDVARSPSATYAFLWGVLVAAVLVAAGLLTGFLTFVNRLPAVTSGLSVVWVNLGSSSVLFLLDLIGFLYTLGRMRSAVVAGDDDEARYWSKFNLITVSLFFGIGVIYTAIGMQSALSHALGGLEPAQADSVSSWMIFERLVNGGILTALTTTIVGGIGGFALRITRHLAIGRLGRRIRGAAG